MDVELFVYGVPYGDDFWGKEEDRKYFGNFYNESLDEVKMLIQNRLSNGRPYCYYNYMVYKDVVDNIRRPGSYFGISLRFDAYCKDIMNMYRILDTIYNVYVLGSLLKADKSKLRYTVSSFENASGTLKIIENATLQLVQNAFSNDSFTSLSGFPTSGNNYPTCNLYDCTPENILAAIKQYGKIAISPYYPSGKETAMQQQCNAQILAAKQRYEERLQADANARAREKNEMNTSLSSAKSQIAQLQKAVSQKDNRIDQLSTEVSQLSSEIRKIGRTKRIDQIIAPLKEPIAELAIALKGIPTEPHEREHRRIGDESKKVKKVSVTKITKALLPFVNFIMLILIAVGMLCSPMNTTYTGDAGLTTKVDSLTSAIQALQNRLDDIGKIGIGADYFDIKSVRIDIHGYNGGKLSKHKTYEVEAIGGIGGGSWEGKGCNISKTDNPNIVHITPTESTVKITYRVENQTIDRELTAK